MNKLQRALNVVKDLKSLDFEIGKYEAKHPQGKYTIWLANGFLFVAFYKIDGEYVDDDHNLSKFGAIGKVLVWWQIKKQVAKYKEKCKKEKREQEIKTFTNLWSK